MNCRFALSLLTALALLWQGAVSAAMLPMFMSAKAATTLSPCHMQHEQARKAPARPNLVKDCCAGVQCHCAAACSASALPFATTLRILLPRDLPKALAVISGFTSAALPQPLRPPILRSV